MSLGRSLPPLYEVIPGLSLDVLQDTRLMPHDLRSPSATHSLLGPLRPPCVVGGCRKSLKDRPERTLLLKTDQTEDS